MVEQLDIIEKEINEKDYINAKDHIGHNLSCVDYGSIIIIGCEECDQAVKIIDKPDKE